LEFFKYWPSSHGSNKLVIKAKIHAPAEEEEEEEEKEGEGG